MTTSLKSSLVNNEKDLAREKTWSIPGLTKISNNNLDQVHINAPRSWKRPVLFQETIHRNMSFFKMISISNYFNFKGNSLAFSWKQQLQSDLNISIEANFSDHRCPDVIWNRHRCLTWKLMEDDCCWHRHRLVLRDLTWYRNAVKHSSILTVYLLLKQGPKTPRQNFKLFKLFVVKCKDSHNPAWKWHEIRNNVASFKVLKSIFFDHSPHALRLTKSLTLFSTLSNRKIHASVT